MLMMMSQILKSADFTKTQKSQYLKNETYFLQIKNSLIAHQGLLYDKNSFVVEVTFKEITSLLSHTNYGTRTNFLNIVLK